MELNKTGREFSVNGVTINEVAKIKLEDNEMISFIKNSKEYDFVAKDWGYYATPSINGRLKNFGYKTALVKNPQGRFYINVVDEDKLEQFYKYLEKEKSEVVEWLDERLV